LKQTRELHIIRRLLFCSALVLTCAFQIYVLTHHESYWSTYQHGDDYLHLAWGVTIFLGLIDVAKWSVTDALLGSLVWQLYWEASEHIAERLTHHTHLDHFFFDGLKDTVVNLVGALTALCVLLCIPNSRSDLQKKRWRKTMILFLLYAIPVVIIGSVWFALYAQSLDLLYAASTALATATALWFGRIQ
jgi:hypothetical protein